MKKIEFIEWLAKELVYKEYEPVICPKCGEILKSKEICFDFRDKWVYLILCKIGYVSMFNDESLSYIRNGLIDSIRNKIKLRTELHDSYHDAVLITALLEECEYYKFD